MDLQANIRTKVAFKAVFSAFLIILAFCVLGKGIFELFGITIPALRITGGVLVFLVGYQMLHGKKSQMHHIEEHDSGKGDDVMGLAISPLALPILAGPGTIATAMNNTATGNVNEIFITVAVFTLLCVITYFCFLYGQKMVRLLGDNGMSVITRFNGANISGNGDRNVDPRY